MPVKRKTTPDKTSVTPKNVSVTNTIKENVEERAIKFICNDEQRDIVKRSYNDAISIFIGKAGSGKTALGTYIAINEKIKKNNTIGKIVITRPTVSDEQLGFLPGDIKDKLDPWMQPIYHNMYQCLAKQKVIKMLEDGDIEISPIAYMRGRTLNNCLVTGEVILTNNGYRTVDDIHSNIKDEDCYVLTYNEDKGINEFQPINFMRKSEITQYVMIELEDGTITKTTLGHKFYTPDGLVESKDLKIGDEILSL